MRIGTGYDVHRLISGRKLVLGGVTIPFEKGLLGHSDADVLVHAACDALLGAAGLGDIGLNFPDSDQKYKDISSIKLLAATGRMVAEKGFTINNMDATIFAQAPEVAPYKKEMQKNIARAVEIDEDRVNIKATTTEGLGMIGRGEGIGAMCAILIKKTN